MFTPAINRVGSLNALLLEDEVYVPYLTLPVADALGADVAGEVDVLVEDDITVDSVDAAFEVVVAAFSGGQYNAFYALVTQGGAVHNAPGGLSPGKH